MISYSKDWVHPRQHAVLMRRSSMVALSFWFVRAIDADRNASKSSLSIAEMRASFAFLAKASQIPYIISCQHNYMKDAALTHLVNFFNISILDEAQFGLRHKIRQVNQINNQYIWNDKTILDQAEK